MFCWGERFCLTKTSYLLGIASKLCVRRSRTGIELCRPFSQSALSFNRLKEPERKPQGISREVFTIPNGLTLTRIACAPIIGYWIFTNHLTPALALFGYSCVTDFLDGFIARRYELRSVAGTILDPMADKILMLVTTVSLTFAPGPQLIPIPLAVCILGRDVFLGIAGMIIRYTSMKTCYNDVTWKAYWDFFKYPSVEVKPTLISKWNTFLQMIYLGWAVSILLLSRAVDHEKDAPTDKLNWETLDKYARQGFQYMGYIVGITTVVSGASYIYSKNAVKILMH